MRDDADDRLFPPGRDHRDVPRRPIPLNVDSAVDHEPTHTRASNLHLLRDCLALGKPAHRRPPAKVRLEEALGPELTRRLLRSLSASKRP
jgi:hypothetical protein